MKLNKTQKRLILTKVAEQLRNVINANLMGSTLMHYHTFKEDHVISYGTIASRHDYLSEDDVLGLYLWREWYPNPDNEENFLPKSMPDEWYEQQYADGKYKVESFFICGRRRYDVVFPNLHSALKRLRAKVRKQFRLDKEGLKREIASIERQVEESNDYIRELSFNLNFMDTNIQEFMDVLFDEINSKFSW